LKRSAACLRRVQSSSLGIFRIERLAQFLSLDDVRSWALKILASMAQLSQDERRHVLQPATKVNRA
jgi:hypothetical protein